MSGVRCLLVDAVITAPCEEHAGVLRSELGLDIRSDDGRVDEDGPKA